MKKLRFPTSYYGGKSRIVNLVWSRFGNVKHYLEPFFGSGAVLLGRPNWRPTMLETVCEKDPLLANVWRALQHDPDAVARICDYPISHVDLVARRKVLLKRKEGLWERMVEDEKFYDVELAGYWIWVVSASIKKSIDDSIAIPSIDGTGGVNGISIRSRNISNSIDPRDPYSIGLFSWFRALSERIRYVNIVCGDWTKITGGSWQTNLGVAGIFLDPPYSVEKTGRSPVLYLEDVIDPEVSRKVREWAIERGKRKDYRIALCGFEGEHEMPNDWECIEWKRGTYKTRDKERIWFSPYCLRIRGKLWGG